MQINRRNFLVNSVLLGAALYLPPNANAQSPYPEIFGIDVLRYHIFRIEEDDVPAPLFLFKGKIGNMTIGMTEDGILSAGSGTLHTEIKLNENGSQLELSYHDRLIKGYVEDRDWYDGLSFMLTKDDDQESGSVSETGYYSFYHFRKQKGKKLSIDDVVASDWLHDGSASYNGDEYPFLSGVYKPDERMLWPMHEVLLKKSRESFRFFHSLYRETLQQVILELEKQGKLVLSR